MSIDHLAAIHSPRESHWATQAGLATLRAGFYTGMFFAIKHLREGNLATFLTGGTALATEFGLHRAVQVRNGRDQEEVAKQDLENLRELLAKCTTDDLTDKEKTELLTALNTAIDSAKAHLTHVGQGDTKFAEHHQLATAEVTRLRTELTNSQRLAADRKTEITRMQGEVKATLETLDQRTEDIRSCQSDFHNSLIDLKRDLTTEVHTQAHELADKADAHHAQDSQARIAQTETLKELIETVSALVHAKAGELAGKADTHHDQATQALEANTKAFLEQLGEVSQLLNEKTEELMANAEARHKEASEAFKGQTEALSKLLEDLSQLVSTKAEELSGVVSTQAEGLSGLVSTKAGALSEKADRLQTDAKAQERLEALQGLLDALGGVVTGLKDQVAATAAAATQVGIELKGENTELSGRVEGLEGELAKVRGELEQEQAAHAATAADKAKVEALQKAVLAKQQAALAEAFKSLSAGAVALDPETRDKLISRLDTFIRKELGWKEAKADKTVEGQAKAYAEILKAVEGVPAKIAEWKEHFGAMSEEERAGAIDEAQAVVRKILEIGQQVPGYGNFGVGVAN